MEVTGVSLTEVVCEVPLDSFIQCHLGGMSSMGGMGGMEVTGVSLTESVGEVPLDAFVRCHLGGMGGMQVLNLSEQRPCGCDRKRGHEWYQCLLWSVNFLTSDSVEWLTSSNVNTEGIIFKTTVFACKLLADK